MKLDLIFQFMNANRQYNHELQEKYYRSAILWHDQKDQLSKIMSILYGTANTQSQPKIDELSKFFRFVWSKKTALSSFKTFVELFNPKPKSGLLNYESLFLGLVQQTGWGPKTSALFIKSIFHIHNCNYDNRLKIWQDAPSTIECNDKLYLPVDRVIIEVFKQLDDRKWNFHKINKFIHERYSGDDIEVWDDLWFWGFITQKVVNRKRVLEWNPNKYWSLEFSNKSNIVENEIKDLALEFLSLLK